MKLERKILAVVFSLLVIGCATRPSSKARSSAPQPIQTQGKKDTQAPPSTAPAVTAPGPALTPEANNSLNLAAQMEREGRHLAALKEYVNLSVNSPSKQHQEYFRLKSLEITENRLSEDDLDRVASDSDYGFVRGHALFRLGELSLQRRDTSSARRYFSSVISFLPESDIAARAQEYISQIDSIRYVEPRTIGVILPLSGKSGTVAQRTLRSIQMGLGLHNTDSKFKLAVMDSEGNPDNARRAVERLVKEDSVIAIVGGLLSKTASAEVSKADELGVPTVVLSQKSGITDVGPSVFRNSVTSDMQVHQLVRVAMEEMGMRRFAILYPNDPYGTEYANIFWDEVLARGGTIAAAQTYKPNETNFQSAIQRMVGTYYIEARMDEFRAKTKEIRQSRKGKSARQELKLDDVLQPIVDFDAIFIPDSSKTLGQISAFLSYTGVKGVKLLGTNLWNSPGINKRAGNFSSNLLFVDGVLNQSENYQKSKFVQEYRSIFGEDPGLLEIQAYDSALILRHLILEGATSRDDLSQELSKMKRLPGALGPLQMSSNREVLRPVMALTLSKEGQIIPYQKPVTP